METYILKSTLFMGIFLGAYYLLLSREKMHRFNRFYLLSGLVFSLVLPFAVIPFYVEAEVQPVQQLPIETLQATAAMPVVQTEAPPVNYWAYGTMMVYAVIVTLLAVRFVLNILRFYKVKRQNTISGYEGATLVLMNEEVLPHTFMNTIFINKNEYDRRLIEPELLTHELAHVQQKHTLDVLFVELLKTVFWFNPLLYLYKKAIQTNHEFLADEAVISRHDNIPTYQLLLLDKATPPLAYALASSINFSTTKKRFTMMTKTTTKVKRTLLQALMLPVVAITTTLLCHEVIAQEPKVAKTHQKASASLKNDRDKYYSGVRIIINDEVNGVHIDKPYEEVSEEIKDRYYITIPGRLELKQLPASEFKKLGNGKKYVVTIDDKRVDNASLKNKKSTDFASYILVYRAKESLTKERPQFAEYHFYTQDYYNSTVKKQKVTHYPSDVYRITLTKGYKDDNTVAAKPTETSNSVVKDVDFKWPPSDKIKSINVYKNSEAQNDSLKKARPDLFKVPGTEYSRIHITYEDDKGVLKKANLFVDQSSQLNQGGAMHIKAVSFSQATTRKERNDSPVYNFADLDPQPEFPGGMGAFLRHVLLEFKIPDVKEDNTYRIFVSFVVETDGSMSNYKVLKDPGFGLGDEAIRTLKTITTKWTPGKKDGKDVRTSYSMPITVNLKA
ncbi:MAG: M56 family metallopeptidase [Bacteroidia bacterium]